MLMGQRPVLYLDLDDTLISWADGTPRAAGGARGFLLWALEHFEVRWLTTWCPGGEMSGDLLEDLARMLGIPRNQLAAIRGLDWDGTGSKANGIAWVEHLVGERSFIWLEDEKGFGDAERAILAKAGRSSAYIRCNVSVDGYALDRVHRRLMAWLQAGAVA